ncbi:MAG: SGNH/GDSL hydrolase family protein [Bacilli bacterium]|nr:SGNH/GDSL hydrolase family protein [Bacilli bacterium]
MLGLNDLKSVINKLHQRYPNVRIFVNSVYYLASNYPYDDAKSFNKSIDNFNRDIKSYCSNNSSYLTYIDITSGLYTNGYLDSSISNDSEGIHINSDKGKQTLVNNIIMA